MPDSMGPDPDALLRAISQEEEQKRKGRLKIFLGMAAGVGKTFAMLEEAQRLHKSRVSIVVGVIETHGREETAKRLEGLEIVPLKETLYKGASFQEMDIDAILKLHPEIVLIDELAHSNVPGSRHPKRWQDVLEILDHGIDVYTTLNVQHIESLKDIVENIAGVTIRETVPDKIIETAAFIELIDITTNELLHRLKEGKVYLGDQSVVAAYNFFQEDRLTALREIVLRYAAEKIDHDLHGMVSTLQRENGWKPRERLLVAVSHSPHSQKLIRTTRRLAANMNAPWIALHVNDGRALSADDMSMLSKNIALARDMGAEVLTMSDPEIAQTIARVARHRGVTQIIIGRPPKRMFFDFIPSYTLLDDLARECNEIDIHVIRQTLHPSFEGRRLNFTFTQGNWSPYLTVCCFVAGLSLLSWYALAFINYKVIGFLFLLGILFLSLFFRAGPIFLASVLYAWIWDMFFIPSEGTLNEDHALLLLYLLTAIFTGVLTDRVKRNREMLTRREETASALYEIAKEIAAAPSSQLFTSVREKVGTVLNGFCGLILKKIDDGLLFDGQDAAPLDHKEQATATWVFENGKEAGWSTSTLPASGALYLPLKGFNEVVGVICFRPATDNELTIEEKNFLYTVGQLLAAYLERSYSQERQQKLEHYNKVERIYQTILNLLSEQLEKPLDQISRSVKDLKAMRSGGDEGRMQLLVKVIDDNIDGLFHVLENLSAMAKLSSGLISVTKGRHSINDLIDTCCEVLHKVTEGRQVTVSIEEGLPLLDIDFSLVELLFCNLIVNAVDNSPPQSNIEIKAERQGKEIVISIADEGKGIPDEMLDTVFEKFYRIPGTTSAGLGLGLSIGKTIAEIHGGALRVKNRSSGGAVFFLTLPVPR